jgi:periplasmic glucans biosynthesis protein
MASLPSLAATSRAAGRQFSRDTVLEAARSIAAHPFKPPPSVPEDLAKLSPEQYRKISYRENRAIWGGTPTRFSVGLFPPGYLYRDLIDVEVVESGESFPLIVDEKSFDVPDPGLARVLADAGKFAGFRLHYPLNTRERADDFLIFRGASNFRGHSRGQLYGVTARGLAIDVAEPQGEEFPVFRRFWIERPSSRANSIVVHALLDSRRVAGAYRFGIYPGNPLSIDVEATLFPRAAIRHVGLGALNSMYLFGPMSREGVRDYRHAVHHSHGLAMISGRGEQIWRALSNPTTLQISSFIDKNPAGFGLVQRDRRFERFQDLESQHGRRPSAWIEPRGEWGPGHVQLIEIPSRSEANDNIIAYWRPEGGIPAGKPFRFAYRISWPNDAPRNKTLARVVYCAGGMAPGAANRQVVIDYAGGSLAPENEITIDASIGQGRILRTRHLPNREVGGIRVVLTFEPGDAKLAELRVQPKRDGEVIGETWLYRWTAV